MDAFSRKNEQSKKILYISGQIGIAMERQVNSGICWLRSKRMIRVFYLFMKSTDAF